MPGWYVASLQPTSLLPISRTAIRDWESLLPYHEKSETFHKPAGNEINVTASYDLSVHGTSGPVQASYNVYVSPQFDSLYNGLRSLNVSEMVDPNGGDNVGVGWITSSVDPKTQTRSSSQSAYRESFDARGFCPEGDPLPPAVTPNLGRKNLVVITSALASKVNFASVKVKGDLVATSVTFLGGVNSTASYTAVSDPMSLPSGLTAVRRVAQLTLRQPTESDGRNRTLWWKHQLTSALGALWHWEQGGLGAS